MARCPALTAKGDQCSGTVAKGAAFCYLHDPAFADQCRANASKAAKSKGGSELADLKAELRALFDGVKKEGGSDPRRAAVAAQVANVLLRALSIERDLPELEELVQRVEKLEASL
jgi:hypothetical protein